MSLCLFFFLCTFASHILIPNILRPTSFRFASNRTKTLLRGMCPDASTVSTLSIKKYVFMLLPILSLPSSVTWSQLVAKNRAFTKFFANRDLLSSYQLEKRHAGLRGYPFPRKNRITRYDHVRAPWKLWIWKRNFFLPIQVFWRVSFELIKHYTGREIDVIFVHYFAHIHFIVSDRDAQ